MALQAVSVKTAAYRLALSSAPEIRSVVIEGLAPGLATHMASVVARPAYIKKLDVDSAEMLVSLMDDPVLLDSVEACDKRVGVVNAILSRRRYVGLVPALTRASYKRHSYFNSEATKVALAKGTRSSGSYKTLLSLEAVGRVRNPDPEIIAEWMAGLSQDDLPSVLTWFCSSRLRHVDSLASAIVHMCLRSEPEVLERSLHAGNSAAELCLQTSKRLTKETPVQAFYLLSRTRRVNNTSILEHIKPRLASGSVGFSSEFLAKLDASHDLGLQLLCDRIDPSSAADVADNLEQNFPGDLRFDQMRLATNPKLIDGLLSEASNRGWFSGGSQGDPRRHTTLAPYRIGALLCVPGISEDSIRLLLEVAETSAAVRFLISRDHRPKRWMFDTITSSAGSSTIMWSFSDSVHENLCMDNLQTMAESLVSNSADLADTLSNGFGFQAKCRPIYEAITRVLVGRLGDDSNKWGVFGGLLSSLRDCRMSEILDATEAVSG